jgi:hypothetical protein
MTDVSRLRFVDNLPAALIAVGLTGFAGYSTVKALLHPQPLHGSILLMQFPGISYSFTVGFNILLELLFVATIVGVALSVRGWECILVCCYSALLFLSQTLYLLPNAMTEIRWVKAFCAFISFVAALLLLFRLRKSQRDGRRISGEL